jgi:hypothetical protein
MLVNLPAPGCIFVPHFLVTAFSSTRTCPNYETVSEKSITEDPPNGGHKGCSLNSNKETSARIIAAQVQRPGMLLRFA